MRNRLIVLLIILCLLSGIFSVVVVSEYRSQNLIDHGSVMAAVEKTLAKDSPVRDDLISRGLVTFPNLTENTPTAVPGKIKAGEIEDLIKDEIYRIDEEGCLQFGPSFSIGEASENGT